MSSKSRGYIYIYDNLCIGGIQNYIVKMTRYLRSDNYPVFWVHKNSMPIDESYSQMVSTCGVVIIGVDNMYEYVSRLKEYIGRCNLEEITVITFTIPDFVFFKQQQKDFSQYRIDTYYYVPNFKGRFYYLEETFFGCFKTSVRKRMGNIIREMHENDEIRYFAASHQEVMSKYYEYSLEHTIFESRVPPIPTKEDVFDEQNRREVFNRKEFKMLSVSRFDFPHKGFIIGLIGIYGELKKKYPYLTYDIIGYYDAGLKMIHEAIEKLESEAKKDIHIYGKCSPEELPARYLDANINISVAGCCSLGAKEGVPSLSPRHFTYECEVYGFYNTHKHMVTSDEPGLPVAPFIEKVINMDEEAYIKLCKAEFDERHVVWTKSSVLDHNKIQNRNMGVDDIEYVFKTCRWIERIHPFRAYCEAIKEQGMLTLVKRKLNKLFKNK